MECQGLHIQRHHDYSFEWVKMYKFTQRQKTYNFDVWVNVPRALLLMMSFQPEIYLTY